MDEFPGFSDNVANQLQVFAAGPRMQDAPPEVLQAIAEAQAVKEQRPAPVDCEANHHKTKRNRRQKMARQSRKQNRK